MNRGLLGSLLLLIVWIPQANAVEPQLPEPVRHILDIRKVPHDSVSIFVRDVDSGEVVLRWQDGVPRNPASTMKLLTTLVGLDVLGPTYRWRTEIHALGEIENGTLEGDILIKGYGDPFLVTERVWQMLRLVRQVGIDEIDGNLVIDDSHFDVPEQDPGDFDNQPLRASRAQRSACLARSAAR
jgi:D-alanyl-D-alanine carboxypeptidase/D-alanyl-D-alanine-endopeptidase (penicillin-binding protein 4)